MVVRGRAAIATAIVVAAIVAVTVAGCTSSPSAAPAVSDSAPVGSSAATSTPSVAASGSTTATPTSDCPLPAGVATPPVDFPHPALTHGPLTSANSSADATLAAQGLAATAAVGGPVAASAFQHYLDATGTYLALPVDGLLSTSPGFVTELNGDLVAAAADAVRRVAGSDTAPCTPVAFTSGWRSHGDVTDPDWRYTLGRFHYEVLGTVFRGATGPIQVTYRVAVGDTYNFDPGTAFAQFERLAVDGRAADFLDGGLTGIRIANVRSTSAELATPGFG